MNISRYVNIDKFDEVCQYPIYFFTSPSGIQLINSASPNVEITSPGLVDFLTPVDREQSEKKCFQGKGTFEDTKEVFRSRSL